MALLLSPSFFLNPHRLILTPSRSRENPRFRRFPPFSASSSSSSSSSSWETEEARWLREEQRWVREEQRWIREEQRWNSEKESLLREITALKLRIEALESTDDKLTVLEAVLRVLKDRVESGPRSMPPAPKPVLIEDADVKELIMEENKDPKGEGVRVAKEKGREMKRMTLRKGSEGDDVRAMQEALQALGFYSGEEDMEYSSFYSGTERAVKTWQASLGSPEDGIMTSELLDKLFGEGSYKENKDKEGDTASAKEKGSANGAAVASVTKVMEIQQTVVKSDGNKEMKLSEHRVFLLGENRWEDPARLGIKDSLINSSQRKDVSTLKCLSCRGEGRLMCTECDGTGEPNIEPQFMEWVDEGAKCPYCEGLGYNICDVCEGKAISRN